MSGTESVDVGPAHDPPVLAPYDPDTAVRWLLATLSFGAGAVHLVMVPQHAQESLLMGLAFAAAGWFQIAFGAAMLAAPRRMWVWLAIAANLGFVATWTISRTVGLPDWTGDGGIEKAYAPDILCVVLEVAVVAGAATLLAAPQAFERRRKPAGALAAVASVAVLVGTTAVLASPSTANHTHTSDVAAAHHHDTDSSSATASTHHGAGASGSASAAGHDHAESTVTYDELPDATRAEVDQVIALWANRYPTAADATSDGWFKATRSLYGIGAHYIRGDAFTGAATFDLLNPAIMLFDGEGPDATFAGVSYVVAAEPEGFTGDDDSWHSHTSVCRRGGTVTSLTEEGSQVWLSEAECTAGGGQVVPLDNDQMIHVWIGPDYIDDAPIFAHDHPDLYDGYSPRRDG